MNQCPNSAWKELLSPLAIASYLAWAAVWFTVDADFAEGWLVAVLLMVFLLAWFVSLTTDDRSRRGVFDSALLVLAVTALSVVVLAPNSQAPILLILLAAQYAGRFTPVGVACCFVVLNGLFAAFLWWRVDIGVDRLLANMAAFCSFQLFAILVIRYARKAEHMAEELQQVNAHLMATRELLSETARDQERLHLSRELHDVAGHKLTALKLNLRALAGRPGLEDTRELQLSSQLASELLDDLRAVVRQLRSDDGIDLARGLRRLAEPLPRPQLRIDIGEDARVPRAEQAEVLLRVAQEGLTNAARHGQASTVFLQLQRIDNCLQLILEDDGRVQGPIRCGNGLTGMRERVEALGGKLSLQPSSRGGLQISATLPLEAA